MAASAVLRGWGDPGRPGSSAASRYFRNNIVKIEAGGTFVYVHKAVAHIFRSFIEEIDRRGYEVSGVPLDDWGYNNRDIRGRPGLKSNHSWGLAIDINATKNPLGVHHGNMPDWIGEVARRHGLMWGKWYSGRKDVMHFEFLGTPADARHYPRPGTAHPAPQPTPTPTPPPPVKEPPTVQDPQGFHSHPLGAGGWILAADGGVFAVGVAKFFGSMGDKPMNSPAMDLIPTPTGNGYWIIGADGGVFAFGDAPVIQPYKKLVAEYAKGERAITGGFWVGTKADRKTWSLKVYSDRLDPYHLNQTGDYNK